MTKTKMMASKSLETMLGNSRHVAGWSNANRVTYGSLWWHSIDLYRHRSGRYFLRETGGGGLRIDGAAKWLSEDDARRFIADHCVDGHTGYAYTQEEVSTLMAGGDVRAETRPSGEIERPDWQQF